MRLSYSEMFPPFSALLYFGTVERTTLFGNAILSVKQMCRGIRKKYYTTYYASEHRVNNFKWVSILSVGSASSVSVFRISKRIRQLLC